MTKCWNGEIVRAIAPLRPRSTLPNRRIDLAAEHCRRLFNRDGIFCITFTTPPMAPEPNRIVAGPRTTSILWLSNVLTLGAWSGLKFETSKTSVPLLRTRTRLSAWPRMTGRLAPAVKSLPPTPGCLASVSPSVGSVCNFKSFSERIVTGCAFRSRCFRFRRRSPDALYFRGAGWRWRGLRGGRW